MPFKSLKNHLSSLATSAISGAVSNFISAGKQKDAGKVSAQLLKKGPFDIPNSPSQALRENPLSFSAVQYPLDLGSNELGHYIIFSSGFLTYQPQQNNAFESSLNSTQGPAGSNSQQNITGKIPTGAIENAAISIYMPPGIKVGYSQSYDGDTETGVSGDVQQALDEVKSAEGASDKILGAHIIGHDAGQLIAEIVTTIEFGGSAEDIARVCHAHPTTSEAVKEAALSVDGRAIHI